MRRLNLIAIIPALTLLLGLSSATAAQEQVVLTNYSANSLVIPMDTTYQNNGIFLSYGLIYQLLKAGVPVDWIIQGSKSYGAVDFTLTNATAVGGSALTNLSYRGGPFVIDSAYYAQALPIVTSWRTAHSATTVHRADAPFTAPLQRRLYAAPTIGVFLDGNEDIAFTYLNAAAIPMSTGAVWPNNNSPSAAQCPQPNCYTENAIAGAIGGALDGALVDGAGRPSVCQIMSMHYAPGNAALANEISREFVRYMTGRPVHAFFECEAVNFFENLGTSNHLLSTGGLVKVGKPNTADYLNSDRPFAQAHGAFSTVGGSYPAWKLGTGSGYYTGTAVMVKGTGSAAGLEDIWVTDNLYGDPANGKISYLGGHQYSTNLPMSSNPGSQGVRYFLNSLFEAPCASEAVPAVGVTTSGPAASFSNPVTFTLDYSVTGIGYPSGVSLKLPLPAGVSFVSATGGGSFASGNVTWNLGALSAGASGSVTVTVNFASVGTYSLTGSASWSVGLTPFTANGNTLVTTYGIHAAPGVSGPITAGATSLSGTSSSPDGTLITIYNGATPIGTATVSGGAWTLTGVSGLVGGESITATAGSGPGLSGPSTPVIVTPAAPVIGGPIVTGTGVTVGGTSTAPNGSTVTVLVNGVPVTCTPGATVSGGTWSCAGLDLNPGDVVTSTVTTNGQTSAGSGGQTVQYAAPSVGGPIYPTDTVIGGTSAAAPGTTITVYQNGTPIGTTTVQVGGTWTLAGVSGLAGNDQITATTGTGAAQSTASAPQTVAGLPGLLRNAALGTLTPSAGQMAAIFPRAGDPALARTDLVVTLYNPGASYPQESTDYSDTATPIVFYQLEANSGNTLRVAKDNLNGKLVIAY